MNENKLLTTLTHNVTYIPVSMRGNNFSGFSNPQGKIDLLET